MDASTRAEKTRTLTSAAPTLKLLVDRLVAGELKEIVKAYAAVAEHASSSQIEPAQRRYAEAVRTLQRLDRHVAEDLDAREQILRSALTLVVGSDNITELNPTLFAGRRDNSRWSVRPLVSTLSPKYVRRQLEAEAQSPRGRVRELKAALHHLYVGDVSDWSNRIHEEPTPEEMVQKWPRVELAFRSFRAATLQVKHPMSSDPELMKQLGEVVWDCTGKQYETVESAVSAVSTFIRQEGSRVNFYAKSLEHVASGIPVFPDVVVPPASMTERERALQTTAVTLSMETQSPIVIPKQWFRAPSARTFRRLASATPLVLVGAVALSALGAVVHSAFRGPDSGGNSTASGPETPGPKNFLRKKPAAVPTDIAATSTRIIERVRRVASVSGSRETNETIKPVETHSTGESPEPLTPTAEATADEVRPSPTNSAAEPSPVQTTPAPPKVTSTRPDVAPSATPPKTDPPKTVEPPTPTATSRTPRPEPTTPEAGPTTTPEPEPVTGQRTDKTFVNAISPADPTYVPTDDASALEGPAPRAKVVVFTLN